MRHKLLFLNNNFLKPEKKSAFMGIDAAIMIGTTVGSTLVFATFAMSIAGILHSQYINIAFSVPKYFLEDGTPSTLLAVFTMLREGFFEIIFMISFAIILFFIFTDTTKLTNGKAKNMTFRTIGMAVMVLFLPVMWDPIAVEIEHASLWLLNPLYSFDPAHPCIPEISETLAPIAAENAKIVEDMRRAGIFAFDDREGFECSPTLRVSYIFEKAVHGVSNQAPEGEGNWWDNTGDAFSAAGETILLGMFGGVTKSMMLAFLMMFSTVVMLGKNLWLMSIMALFPMLAGLAIMPYIGDFAQKLIKMIPPLLMCGIITAGIILAGSSGLQMMEEQINQNRQLYGIAGFTYGMSDDVNMDGSAEPILFGDEIDESENQVDKELNRMDKGILFWFMAVTVLTLAALVPVMMVPELMALSNMAGQMVSTGLIAGAVSVASTVKGTAGGGMRGVSESMSKSGAGGWAGLKSAMTNPHTFSRLGSGVAAGAGAGFSQDVAAGMSLMPGSGPAVREASGGAHGIIKVIPHHLDEGFTSKSANIGNNSLSLLLNRNSISLRYR